MTAKGKVPSGKYRAFAYRPPGHKWADIKLFWRDIGMRAGYPPPHSSPEKQQDSGLNLDVTLFPGKGEGHRLRNP